MLIDWFTVGAQIVNFLVLVWLLKRYLYRPILKAIDTREKSIVSRLEAAKSEQAKARAELEDCRRERQNLERHRNTVLADTKAEAQTERARLLEEAVQAAENLRQLHFTQLLKEGADYQADLIRLTKQEIIAGSRKMVKDLAATELEGALIAVFLSRLSKVAVPSTAGDLNGRGFQGALRMRSSFALSPTQERSLQNEIQRYFHTEKNVEFHTDPNLLLGLSLTAGDQKIGWNVDEYLGSFAADLNALAQKKLKEVGL